MGIFIVTLQRAVDGTLGWVEDFNKSEAWKLLRTAVRAPAKEGRSRRGKRGTQPLSFFPYFLPNATGTATTKSVIIKKPNSDFCNKLEIYKTGESGKKKT